ncbi:MAG: hypothetical protein WCK28_10210 [Burkholderiales bacterium]|jgi:hypothetical protein
MWPAALPAMIYAPAPPAGARAGCRSCEHFHGEWLARGAHAVCRMGARPLVQAQPGRGCAFHLRAPGSDDA